MNILKGIKMDNAIKISSFTSRKSCRVKSKLGPQIKPSWRSIEIWINIISKRAQNSQNKPTLFIIILERPLAGILNKEGMDVARRTVAKYRDMLNIPSSSQRRREARLQSLAAG